MNWSRVYTGRNRNWPDQFRSVFLTLWTSLSFFYITYFMFKHVRKILFEREKKYRQTISIPVYITFIIMLWPCFRTILIYSRYKWYIVRENNGEKRTNLINITEQRGWNGSHEQLAHFNINRNLSLISTMIKNHYKCI